MALLMGFSLPLKEPGNPHIPQRGPSAPALPCSAVEPAGAGEKDLGLSFSKVNALKPPMPSPRAPL